MNRLHLVGLCLLASLLYTCQPAPQGAVSPLTIGISLSTEMASEPLDGRMLLMISTNPEAEPRFEIRDNQTTQQIFGLDVEGLKAGEEAVFDASIFGYPVASLSDLPEGDYYVQGLLHKYETFNLSNGHTVKLPMDRGEGQQWNRAPGNLYSTSKKIHIDPSSSTRISLELDQVIAPIDSAVDTKYIKHIKIQSKLLTEFWGRPMYLGAHVLLPECFEEHPEARYPLAIFHGHFPQDFWGWRSSPPDTTLEPVYSDRFQVDGYNIMQQELAHQLYKDWTGPDFPRVLAIEIQHPTPYYDDSYAVNSAAQGPYGDAITYELIPYIEEQFRGIGEGWARFLYGGSTGGWEALAAQVFYPEEYNSCYAACPDPIDFRAYCLINLYENENAYTESGDFKQVERPGHRNYLGEVDATVRNMNYRERVLGSKSRSGQQFDIWQATYSPLGDDGYPKPIWDKLTGEIDPEVATYWKENYDLAYILKRDWATLGPKLEGKINLYCGDMDNYYLNNAVYLAEEMLEETHAPYYDGEVAYGDRAEHCWNGDPTQPNHITRLRYHQMFIPKWAKWVRTHAPAGADLTSWRY